MYILHALDNLHDAHSSRVLAELWLPMQRLSSTLLLLACVAATPEATSYPLLASRPAGRPVVARSTRATRATSLYAAAAATPLEPRAHSPAVAWGVCGFLGIIGSAIGRLAPIAAVPFRQLDLTPLQWVWFGTSVSMFAYVEGYKAFQGKFSPMLVNRALTLSNGAPAHHVVLAPFYSMGLFHATKKRKIVSWSISLGVAIVVGVVKRLPYPWRSIVDAGVVTGLLYGGTSIAIMYVRALMGKPPTADPCLPKPKP